VDFALSSRQPLSYKLALRCVKGAGVAHHLLAILELVKQILLEAVAAAAYFAFDGRLDLV
jgi:hypothetical protein